jgi:hypothetical protein
MAFSYAAVSRVCDTDETGETLFRPNELTVNNLLKMSETV